MKDSERIQKLEYAPSVCSSKVARLKPKIRSKMAILLSQISLDDYQLKIRALLRNSAFKNEICTLAKGKFVFPSTDETLEVQPFAQIGKPFEWQPKEKPKPKKLTKWQKAKAWFKFFTFQWNTERTEPQTEPEPQSERL